MNLPPFDPPKPFEILVLDDQPLWLHFVKYVLELELKIAPLVAATALEALDILAKRPVDVVIADLNMPVMDGVQFLKRARVQSPATKVIIMSANPDVLKVTSLALTAAGAVAVISKGDIALKLPGLLRSL